MKKIILVAMLALLLVPAASLLSPRAVLGKATPRSFTALATSMGSITPPGPDYATI